MENTRGLIHIYCGDGKGKTTAAFGLAMRCAGRHEKILILQFLKGQDSGELHTVSRIPEIVLLRNTVSEKFVFQMDAEEKQAVCARNSAMLAEASVLLQALSYRMLVLDEVISAWNMDMIDHQALLHLIKNRPAEVEVVMTGRNPPQELTDIADYISEIHAVRHPYDRGIPARRCIEY